MPATEQKPISSSPRRLSGRWASQTYKNLERVVTLGDQAASLIKQLLTFSRQTESEKHPVSLVPLVKETAKVLKRTLPENIEITNRTS